MKKNYIFLCFCLLLCSLVSYGNPGDTTVVATSPVLNADNSASYDSLLVLPTNKTYRKILLVYTLGSHSCNAGSQYCHQWDYIGNVTIKPPHGDTVELARIITPFATSGWSRFPQPPNWKQDYVFDVTDFAPYLKDTVTINSMLGVGSPGYEISTKLIFIEGTPDRDVVGISKVYSNGSGYYGYTYGDVNNPINSHLITVDMTAPAGTQNAAFRFIVTGHGSDANQCCEFDSHYYRLFLNGNQLLQRDIWREDCGLNQVYPQGGTWIYDRSNWCPGASVHPYYDPLPGITAGNNYNVNLQFQDYTVANPSGQYVVSASVIYYGGMNKSLDASMEDIVTPSSDEQHFRQNPGNNNPVIRIHNSGSTPISSVAFEYGVQDSTLQQYTWSGTLAPLADTTISLPASTTLSNLSASSASGTYQFIAVITSVNGQADEDATNDTFRSSFMAAPDWPGQFIVKFHPGNIGRNGNFNASPAQGSWVITDANGGVVASEQNANVNTDYSDTVNIPTPGFYQLKISNNVKDLVGYCFGLHWWALEQNGLKSGALWVKNMDGANIPMHGYTYAPNPNNLEDGGEHDDFGCEYTQYFYVSNPSTGVDDINDIAGFKMYPNPANKELDVEFAHRGSNNMSVSLINIMGQTVYTADVNNKLIQINTSSYPAGVYTLTCTAANGARKVEKVVIAH